METAFCKTALYNCSSFSLAAVCEAQQAQALKGKPKIEGRKFNRHDAFTFKTSKIIVTFIIP
jgi:hypothetical protein